MSGRSLCPVLVVTGFLGSGKTTLIRALLARDGRAGTAVIVNEAGEVGLDHDLLRRVEERTVLLAGGCLCCARREDLVETLRELLDADQAHTSPVPLELVVIETSGLADAGPVAATITADPVLCHHFRLAGVVTTVDAVTGRQALERHREAVSQAAAADCLILTKADIATPREVSELRARLLTLNPAATLVEATFGEVDLEALLATRPASVGPRPLPEWAPGRHDDAVRSVSVELSEPLDWTVLAVWLSMLLHTHGTRVLRFKALIDTGGPGPVSLNGVGHLAHPPEHFDSWEGARRSRLVFILDGLNPNAVLTSFHRFQERLGQPPVGAAEGLRPNSGETMGLPAVTGGSGPESIRQ